MNNWKTIINDIYGMAISAKLDHKSLIRLLKQKVWDTPKFCNMTQKDQKRIMGYEERRFKEIQMNHVVWGSWWGGSFYERWDSYPEDLKTAVIGNIENPQHHYWLEEKVERKDNGVRIITKTPTHKVW